METKVFIEDTICLLAGNGRGIEIPDQECHEPVESILEHSRSHSRITGFAAAIIVGLILLLFPLTAAAQTEPCNGSPECYETPTPLPHVCVGEISCYNPPAPPPEIWSGYNDGRLNPNPGEYYSVWCSSDTINIWHVVPISEVVKHVSLLSVIQLSQDGKLDVGDNMSVTRHDDTITIYGSNGNRAPEAGDKAFSLNECIEDNGSVPTAPPSETSSEESSSNTQNDVDGLPPNFATLILYWIVRVCTVPILFGMVMILPGRGLRRRIPK